MMGTLVVKRLRDITDALLEELFHGVAIEPILQPNADNNLVPSTTNTNGGTRFDVSARSFWIMSQKAFFLTSGCLTPTLHGTSLEFSNSVLQ